VGVFLLMVSCLLHDTVSLAAASPMKEPSTDTSLRCKMRSLGEVPEGLLILNENRPVSDVMTPVYSHYLTSALRPIPFLSA